MASTPLPKKIWLAGLGAIARAEQEGEDWLDELMEEGSVYENEKKKDLEEALTDLGEKVEEKVEENTHELKRKFSNIEQSFEKQVSKTLSKIGLISKKEVSDLKKRLAEIEDQLSQQ